ncbi:hypothetical protein C8J56DRAFT_1048818 [Mycena floridula]|nr:hypothetical protein C8J56DRAFT_1048818 [Mycena floridula]
MSYSPATQPAYLPPIAQGVGANLLRHAQLIVALAKVEDAPAALAEKTAIISDLKLQLEESEATIKKLFQKTRTERKATETQAESSLSPRRFAQRLVFKKPKAKEPVVVDQTAYNAALKDEMEERKHQTYLERTLGQAQMTYPEIQTKADECMQLKGELRKIYGAIFDGPTLGYPEEDQLEQQVLAARSVVDRVYGALETETRTAENLREAMRAMVQCQARLDDVMVMATDALIGRQRETQKMEAKLQSAHALAQKVDDHVKEARKTTSSVDNIGISSIAEQAIVLGLSDSLYHGSYEKIKTAAADAAKAHTKLKAECDACNARLVTAKAIVDHAIQTLDEYQLDLDSLRRKIFEQVASQLEEEGFDQPDYPPSYRRKHMTATSTYPEPWSPASPSSPSGSSSIPWHQQGPSRRSSQDSRRPSTAGGGHRSGRPLPRPPPEFP